MVNSQARKLVPGSNLSELPQALSSVSCTRSSASCIEPDREAAKARRLGISRIKPSLNSLAWAAVLASLALIGRRSGCALFGGFKLRQQDEELVRHGRVHDVVVMGLQRATDGFLHLRVQNQFEVVTIASVGFGHRCIQIAHISPRATTELAFPASPAFRFFVGETKAQWRWRHQCAVITA